MASPDQAQPAGSVYVSRPDGDSGVQPSLVTTKSPDHPDNLPAADTTQQPAGALPAAETPPAALRARYEEISREVINRLVVDPAAKLDAFDHMNELLRVIDAELEAQAKAATQEGAPANDAPQEGPQADAAAQPAAPANDAPQQGAQAKASTQEGAPGNDAPQEGPQADAPAQPPASANDAPQQGAQEGAQESAQEGAQEGVQGEDGDDATLVDGIRNDLDDAEKKLEKLQERQGKKSSAK